MRIKTVFIWFANLLLILVFVYFQVWFLEVNWCLLFFWFPPVHIYHRNQIPFITHLHLYLLNLKYIWVENCSFWSLLNHSCLSYLKNCHSENALIGLMIIYDGMILIQSCHWKWFLRFANLKLWWNNFYWNCEWLNCLLIIPQNRFFSIDSIIIF